jgi:hypothetical protein
MTEMGGDGVKVEFEAIGGKDGQAALERLLSGRMAIVIAHRLSTIRNADVIWSCKTGRLSNGANTRNCWRSTACIAHFTSGSLSRRKRTRNPHSKYLLPIAKKPRLRYSILSPHENMNLT